MFKRIGAFFTTPVFAEDEDLTRVASLLNIVLNIVTFALPLIVIKGLLSAYPAERYIVIILALVLAQGLRWLMWNRKAKLSGFLLAVMATSGTTAVLYYAGTVRANALPFYMIAIVFAGLLAGNRAAIATALLSSVSVLGLNLAENAGSLP